MHTLKKITLGVVGLAAVAGAAFWLATGRSEIAPLQQIPVQEFSQQQIRSEERRVGKECRSRWSPYH